MKKFLKYWTIILVALWLAVVVIGSLNQCEGIGCLSWSWQFDLLIPAIFAAAVMIPVLLIGIVITLPVKENKIVGNGRIFMAIIITLIILASVFLFDKVFQLRLFP